jgi:outer membrane lipoprotein-sorting protein
MHFGKVYLALALFLILPISMFSQQMTTPPRRDPQAISILQQCLAAMGAANLPIVTDLTLSGQIVQQRAQEKAIGTIVLKTTGPDKVRVETNIHEDNRVHIVNGNRMREIRGLEDNSMPFHATLNHAFPYVPLLSGSISMTDADLAASFLGEEIVNGSAVYHVHTEKVFAQQSEEHARVLAKLTSTDFYIDKTTFLLAKRVQELPSTLNAKASFPIEFVYSDYLSIQGIMIPHAVAVYLNGQESAEIQFNSAVLNTGLNTSEFEVKQ